MIRAKFRCDLVSKTAYYESVELCAVGPNNGEVLNSENASFAKATPNGSLKMTIDNPDAQGFFKPGKSYYLDFTEANQ